jgi:hypothetical protein
MTCEKCRCEFAGKWGAGVPIEEAPTPHHWHKTEGGGYLAHGEAHTEDGSPLFNEASLRRAIVEIWGEHGAHVAVFDRLLLVAREMRAIKRQIEDALTP